MSTRHTTGRFFQLAILLALVSGCGDSEQQSRIDKAHVELELARRAAKCEDMRSCLKHAEASIELHPTADAYACRANARICNAIEGGDFTLADALADTQAGLKLDPNHINCLETQERIEQMMQEHPGL